MWRYKRIATGAVICNHPCKVRRVRLYYNNEAAMTATIYNEDSTDETNEVCTLATLGTGSTYRISDEIDFGEQGADFYEGCYIKFTAGEVLVLYKD
ncbi:hypothetical protein ES708_31503 [subsurface metagenome]